MTFGSLFAGIGGMDLGLERAGMTCKWQVEIDPFCQKVLTKHWPEVPKYGDIREATGKQLGYVDCIAGGFPCQDVSLAGKRQGITGPRSGLWKEYYRLICEIRPKFIIVENVAGLYLGGGIQRVLGDLAEGGYDAEWNCIPAAGIGAPHRRDRVFIVAYPRGFLGSFQLLLTWNGQDIIQGWENAKEWGIDRVVTSVGTAPVERFHIEWRERDDQPSILRMVDGLPASLLRIKGCGNAVVPQVAEWIGRRVIEVGIV